MRFRLGPTLMLHNIRVECDYTHAEEQFQRDIYHELKWLCNNQYDPDRFASILIKRSGTFHFKYSVATDDIDDKLVNIDVCMFACVCVCVVCILCMIAG